MDNNQNGEFKRPKRPRIGGIPADGSDNNDSRFEKVQYGRNSSTDGPDGIDAPRYERPRSPYQPRQNNGFHRNNYNNGYSNNRDTGYGNRDGYSGNRHNYQPRPRYNREGGEDSGYQPRQYNNNRPGYNSYNRPNNQPNNYNGYNRENNYKRANTTGGEDSGYRPRQYNNNRPNNRPYNNNRPNNQDGYNRNNNYRPGGNNRGYQQRQQRPGKSFTPRPKRVFYEEPEIDPTAEIRLNKYIANAGICSRREADELIQKGEIKVNGNVVTELGTKIKPKDVVEYKDNIVTGERKCYVLLNKPKDCVTTVDDPNGRLTVMDLVKNACEEHIYPVGRLDRNTTGVLLLTNDGDLASKLTHPQYVKKKIYHVWTDHDIAEEDMQSIADGIELDDGPIHADAISYANDTDKNQAGIEIHSGRNRIVRRIFEALGYHVTKLDRVYFAGLTKKNLPRGRWRYLTQEEVNYLKMGSFE